MSEIIGEGEVRRFFELAVVAPCDGGFGIELDGRTVKTPLGDTFIVPTSPLAEAIAGEWNAQGDKIVPASMPLASLCNAAIDRIAPDPRHFLDQMVSYARSDLLCYWAEEPDDLVQQQRETWQPVLDWAGELLGVPFVVTSGVIPVEQSQKTLDAVADILAETGPFHLTGLVDLAGRMSSVLLALAVWKSFISAEEAFKVAFLDEFFQEQQWGEDSEAAQRRTLIHGEILGTAQFLALLDKP